MGKLHATRGNEADQHPGRHRPRAGGWGGGAGLAAALHRVLDGARDAGALAEEPDLDGTDCLILSKVLEALEAGGEVPLPGPPPVQRAEGVAHPAVRGLAPLVGAVVALCQGNGD